MINAVPARKFKFDASEFAEMTSIYTGYVANYEAHYKSELTTALLKQQALERELAEAQKQLKHR